MSKGSDPNDELMLLERVFLRIGSADSDDQLESMVTKFLPPVLLKLASSHEVVRKKVIELLTHISKRIKARPNVQLPVSSLLDLYQDPNSNSYIVNFAIIYIKIGFPRLPGPAQTALIPALLNVLPGKIKSQQDSLLILIVLALSHLDLSQSKAKDNEPLFSIIKLNVELQNLLFDFLLDVLILPYGFNFEDKAPPGMSIYSYKRIVSDGLVDSPDTLEKFKLGVLKFISNKILSEPKTFCLLTVAASDTKHTVASDGDLELRRTIGGIDWSDSNLVAPLYTIYLGSKSTDTDHARRGACIRLRMKILPFLNRCKGAAVIWPTAIQILFDSLYGENTIPKLKTLALQFARVIIQQVDSNQLKAVGPVLLKSGFQQLLTDQNFENSARQHVYNIIGHLVNRVPSLIHNDLTLIKQFFDALSTEEANDVQVSVREALLTMCSSFTDVDSNLSQLLLTLLSTQIESKNPMARLVAARYLNCVFPATHAPSRYLLLIASGDSQDDVSIESFKALYGPSYQRHTSSEDLENVNFDVPSFSELVNLISEKASEREGNSNLRSIIRNTVLPFNIKTFVEVLNYLSVCLTRSAGAKSRTHPNDDSPLIAKYLTRLHNTEPAIIQQYLKLVNQLLTVEKDSVALKCLVETVCIVPNILGVEFATKLDWIRALLNHTREDVRVSVATLFGAVASYTQTNDELALCMTNLLTTLRETGSFVVENQHGALLSLANILERRSFRKKLEKLPSLDLSKELHKSIALSAVEFLSHQQALLISAACIAIGQIGRVAALPFPDEETKDLSNPGKMDLVNKLEELYKGMNVTTKIKEKAIESLGLICVGNGFPYRKLVIEKLLSIAKQSKEIEIHLEVGFALVNCVLGSHSPQARDYWTESKTEFKLKHGEVDKETLDLLTWLLTELLDKIIPTVHPNSRQASCVWLLTLFKHCNHLGPVSQSLVKIQSAFMDFLSDNNDIIQDFASKGLAIVYESGTEDMKKELVTLLVQQLVEGRKTAAKVTDDTKIFEEGAITTPSGGNLSTYKELCALASETNQPDLVYKFMHLVNHKAIWDSKKGAAFGFSSILQSAGEDLSPYLSKIIPKLYRYQFDPVPKIQSSMSSIWSAIVPESQKTVDLYHKEIFNDLISNLTSSQWRVRLSCCVALADFLRGGGAKVFDDCVPQFAELWSQVFRVMDDVHEGTRNAAISTAKTLSTICVRHLDIHQNKTGVVLIETILPVILERGVYSPVADVVKVSLETISKIVGACGSLLTPHLSKLIPALLQATGELESPALNYLSVRSGTDSNRQEVIDSVRASHAKSHYTTETVTKCVPHINEKILNEMLPSLIDLLGANVGLGAKVATAHFFVLLSHQMTTEEMQPHSGKILRVLLSGLTDRNSTLRKTYAQTIGHVIRSAKDSSVDKLFEKLKNSYLEKEDEGIRTAIGQALQAISRQNQELVRSRPDIIIPLVFFAMHMTKNKNDLQSVANVEMWEDVWHDIAPGTEITLNRNMECVCQMLAQTLTSPSWNMKAQAARAICTVATKSGNNLEEKQFVNLVTILVNGLSGRTWEGKECLLDALSILCKSTKNVKTSFDMDLITDAVLKECSKEQNFVYRQKALKALGQILQALEKDRFSQVYELVQSILSKDLDEDMSDSEDRESRTKSREEFLNLREIAFNVLGESWPLNLETQKKYQEQVALQCVQYMNNNTRQVQVSVMVALYSYVDKLILLTQPPGEEQNKVLSYVHQALDLSLGVGKHTRLRKESLNLLLLVLKKLRENKNKETYHIFNKLFDKYSEELSKDTSPEVKSRFIDVKEFLVSS